MAFATCVATAFEQRRPLPVDAVVPDPLFISTHAITIDAAPDQVWPWIAQMGARRAGWYSWDAIDSIESGGHLMLGQMKIVRATNSPASLPNGGIAARTGWRREHRLDQRPRISRDSVASFHLCPRS